MFIENEMKGSSSGLVELLDPLWLSE